MLFTYFKLVCKNDIGFGVVIVLLVSDKTSSLLSNLKKNKQFDDDGQVSKTIN